MDLAGYGCLQFLCPSYSLRFSMRVRDSIACICRKPMSIRVVLSSISSLDPSPPNSPRSLPICPTRQSLASPLRLYPLDTHSLVFHRPKSLTVPSWATLLTSEGKVAVAILI